MMLRRPLTAACLIAATLVPGSSPATAATLPSGFVEQIVFTGLTQPTNVEFAPDGRIFVAQKNGVIKVYDSLSDPTPDTFADLSAQVNNFWDRGLLGLALPPNFPTSPYVYVLYTYDAKPGGTAPTWGDTCPNPPGDTADGCVVTGRLSRLKAVGNQMSGPEEVLVTDWCQQYPSHSVGDLAFGADGALYASGGDGASFNWTDWGQDGNPVNPCGDPGGANPTPPTAEGGALRSQDVRSTGDPTGLNGSVIRIDPATGAGLPGNPFASSTDANARRIHSYGLRNPFRLTVRPGTSELWAGDVGWSTWEEIDRLAVPGANFGWPCHEGGARQPGYDGANLNLCESLYTAGGATGPHYAYNHASKVVAGETCPTGGSAVSGLAFYPASGGAYPAEYRNALFFADYSRGCVWSMAAGADGLPDPTRITTFAAGASSPVDLEIGPGGDLYYADINGGTIRRLRYYPANRPPVPAFTATPSSGPAPLTVAFDGSGSTDPDPGDILTYAWDFDGNGTTDATGRTASYTYATAGPRTARLTVTDSTGAAASTTKLISPGDSPPVPVIDTPAGSLLWKVGDTVGFTGHATDAQDGTLPASRLHWQLVLQHCSSATDCHSHPVQEFTGSSGSFTAPDHEYPSHLDLILTATDSAGLTGTTTVRLDPRTVDLTFGTAPAGLQLTVGSSTGTAPFTRTVIVGSTQSVSAPTPQGSYAFGSWSDGGAQTHVLTAPATAATVTATFTPITSTLSVTGTATVAGTGRPLAGATVTLNPGGRTTTTSATGGYAFTGLTPGTYGVTVTNGLGRCVTPATASVIVDGPKVADLSVTARTDGYGYTCVDAARPFRPGSTALALTGDDRVAPVTLPFAFPYYGRTYTSATVDSNGVLSFGAAASAAANVDVPSAGAPNAAIYPFWRDLGLDTGSQVLTAAGPGTFTVEWRNAYVYGYRSHRVTFSVTLSATGDIEVGYQALDARADEQGGSATVGIENETGTVGLRYAYAEPVLRDEISVLFRRP
ncbi:PQQ-dependent sugar dehydrogenase [Longispora sp. K20-0274]|uniref:PQQ-dependent sugar dehydrogenase n=1 Tax=Longispora sp. K20-0274 TaxID=3088255 RepID=UPI00399998E3